MAKNDMLDLEKAMAAPDAQVLPAMARRGEQELLTPDPHIEGVPPVAAGSRFAGAMVNDTRMKQYWLLLVASVITVTNHFLPGGGNTAAAIPGLAKFIVLLCSICLIVRAMK